MRSPEPSSAVAIWVLSFISRLWRRCRGPLLRLIISRLTVQAWTSAGWRASEGNLYHRQQRSSIPNRYLRGGAVACANICSAGCPICIGACMNTGRRLYLPLEHHLRGRSEEHTSELQSLMRISYAVLCLKKQTTHNT